jgi:thiamine transport system permease protein
MDRGDEQVRFKRKGRVESSSILKSSPFYTFLSTPAVVLLALLLVVPLIIILSKAFIDVDGSFTLSRFVTLIERPYTWQIFRFTLYQAFISTIVSIAIALPGSYLLANYRFIGKKVIKAICTVPFVLPSILVVLGFVIFYGNSGLLNSFLMTVFKLEEGPLKLLYTFKAVILAHAFYNFPIALILISSYWEQLNYSYEMAAMVLGSRRSTVFRTITLPRLVPIILSSATLIFLFCFSSFAILLVLGGGPKFTTVEVEIFRRARMTLDLEGAATLSLLSITVTLLIVAFYIWTQRLIAYQESIETQTEKRYAKKVTSIWVKILTIIYLLLSTVFILGPLLGIIYRSFRTSLTRSGESIFTLKLYRQLFAVESVSHSVLKVALSAIISSLIIASITAIIALIISTMLAARLRSKYDNKNISMEMFAMLPMAVSSVIVGLGYYLIASYIDTSVSMMRVMVILAHVVIASPFILRSILPEYRKIPFSYTQASLTLGATVWQTFFHVELPLLKSALITGSAFAFAISLGELNATLVLADSSMATIPIVMYRLIGSYNFAAACALGSVLIFLCAIIFFFSETMKGKKYG